MMVYNGDMEHKLYYYREEKKYQQFQRVSLAHWSESWAGEPLTSQLLSADLVVEGVLVPWMFLDDLEDFDNSRSTSTLGEFDHTLSPPELDDLAAFGFDFNGNLDSAKSDVDASELSGSDTSDELGESDEPEATDKPVVVNGLLLYTETRLHKSLSERVGIWKVTCNFLRVEIVRDEPLTCRRLGYGNWSFHCLNPRTDRFKDITPRGIHLV
ncbi:hypothetical protein QBC44DRAFT_370624 [Cladorrhinum sp. PSN332]|nr:hypothetical protein QBC44DRAFT_370624 [Cladorrhinum sp. PSN332]